MSDFDRREHPDPYAAQGFVDVIRDISYFDEHVYAYHDHQSELDLAPWREGEWVPTAHLIHLFGNNAAELLARWGGADDGNQVLLLTRARTVETRNNSGDLISKASNVLHSYFWQGEALFSDCAAGVFDREFQGLVMRAIGVELRKDDLLRLMRRSADGPVTLDGASVLPSVRTDKPGRGRKPGTGIDDTPHIGAMLALVLAGSSAWDAAGVIAQRPEVEGGGTFDAKQRRLHGKFQAEHRDLSSLKLTD